MSDPTPAIAVADASSDSQIAGQSFKIGRKADVVLLAGPQQVRIQVASEFLRFISPVFDAMFDAIMKEGNALRLKKEDEVVEIPLPEDGGLVVLHALRALYGCSPEAANLPSGVIRDVAVWADKYDLIARFKYIGLYWLRAAPLGMDLVDRQTGWDFLTAAYWLDLPEPFFVMSRFFVLTPVSLLEYALASPDRDLGLRLALAIEELRNANSVQEAEIGLCLDCFFQATKGYVQRQDGCQSPYHLW